MNINPPSLKHLQELQKLIPENQGEVRLTLYPDGYFIVCVTYHEVDIVEIRWDKSRVMFWDQTKLFDINTHEKLYRESVTLLEKFRKLWSDDIFPALHEI